MNPMVTCGICLLSKERASETFNGIPLCEDCIKAMDGEKSKKEDDDETTTENRWS